MKITFLVPFRGLSGGLKVISTYGNSFLRRGYDVTIIYPKRKDLSFKNRIKASIKNKFLKKKDHLDYFKGNLLSVESFNEKDLPISDIYIATGWQTADFLYNTKIDRNKIIYFVQHLETWDGDSAKVLDTYKNSKNIITISKWLKNELNKLNSNIDIPIVHNGKDFHISDYRGEGFDRKYDIGFIGSNVRFKRSDVAINSINAVLKKYPNLKIVIISPHKLNYNLPENTEIFINPKQDFIRETYLQTKIWISTSDLEGFCLPALEAISMGCALVATDSEGIKDIIENGKNGILVSPGDSNLISDEIIKLIENPVKLNTLTINGLESSNKFNWEDSSNKFLNFLENNL